MYNFAICRRQKEAELKLLEEELARRVEEAVRKNVEERLNSEEVKDEIKRRVEEGIKKLFDEVGAQLLKEKDAALNKARQKIVGVMHVISSLSCLIIIYENILRLVKLVNC
jgi:arginine/glutamate-rich protein 1